MFEFKILHKKDRARTGIFYTPHGELLTPQLAFVATDGQLRAIPKEKMQELPIKLTISNTFHTFIKGLLPEIETSGGVGKYMNSPGVTMTDSGGFQVFSMGFGKVHKVGKISSIFPYEHTKEKGLILARDYDNILHITEKGVMFPYDKKLLLFTPEASIAIQERLGADIIFSFDECTSPLNSYEYTKKALERTHIWFLRGLRTKTRNNQALFGVVQGGMFEDLRQISAQFMAKQDVAGFGIGGSLGHTKADVWRILEWINPLLPEEKPRHLLGMGQVKDIFESVERGVDLFDCVIPTREARHKVIYTKKGKINVRKYKNVKEIADKNCPCQMCQQNITLDKLNELYKLDKPQAFSYATTHNIWFFANLMNEIRSAIKKNALNDLKNTYVKYY